MVFMLLLCLLTFGLGSSGSRKRNDAAPYGSGSARLQVLRFKKHPLYCRASLFDEVEDMDEDGADEGAASQDKAEQDQHQVEVIDPVCPLSSPVTKVSTIVVRTWMRTLPRETMK
jgi:hypothetical protein